MSPPAGNCAVTPSWGARRSVSVAPLPAPPTLASKALPLKLGAAAPELPWWRRSVDPRSRGKRRWDALMLVLLLYCTLIIPWNIGFTFDAAERACTSPTPADNCYPRHMVTLDALVDALFWVDIGVSLRTALPARGGTLITSWRPIVDAYARRYLLLDLVSVFPWDALVAGAAAARAVPPSPLALKLAKLPRLLRARLALRALRRGADAVRDTRTSDAVVTLQRLGQLVGAFLLLAHCGACGMWTASRWQVEHTPQCGIHAATGLRPLALRDYRRGVEYSPDADAAQAALCALRAPAGLVLPSDATWSLYCANLPTKYMAMAYFSLTTLVTVGFGDIVPGTNLERCCAMALQLAGCISCAVVFGNMALLLEGWDRAGARLRHRLAALARLCAHHRVPPRLARAVASHAAAQWRAQRGVDMAAVRAALPPCCERDVLLHLYGGALDASTLFEGASLSLRGALAARLRPEVYADGDVIIERGDAGDTLYMLTAGAAVVTVPARGAASCAPAVCARLKPGDCFGELHLLGAGAHRTARVTAVGNAGASVLCLSRADLESVLADFPEAVQPLRAALAARSAAARATCAAVAAATAVTGDANGSTIDRSDDSADEDETPEELLRFGVPGVEDDAPTTALARQLWHVRVAAAAQHRVLRARLTRAAKSFAELNDALDVALAARGIVLA